MHACNRCGQRPGHALLRWGAVLALGAVLEAEGVAGKRHHHTLSHATRSVFGTDRTQGRVAFGVAWVGFCGWYLSHILNSPHNFKDHS